MSEYVHRVYEIGARVQASAHGIKHQRAWPIVLTEQSVGHVQGYRTPSKKGVARLNVRWLSGKDYPPHYDHVTLGTFIEPFGTPRGNRLNVE